MDRYFDERAAPPNAASQPVLGKTTDPHFRIAGTLSMSTHLGSDSIRTLEFSYFRIFAKSPIRF